MSQLLGISKENRPKTDGICVANHTSPIDVVFMSCDIPYAMVTTGCLVMPAVGCVVPVYEWHVRFTTVLLKARSD